MLIEKIGLHATLYEYIYDIRKKEMTVGKYHVRETRKLYILDDESVRCFRSDYGRRIDKNSIDVVSYTDFDKIVVFSFEHNTDVVKSMIAQFVKNVMICGIKNQINELLEKEKKLQDVVADLMEG